MKFTLSWLKEYLNTNATLDEIVSTLNRIGLEVESVVNRATELRDFRCVLVEGVDKHPNSDHLRVCSVRTGETGSLLTVVCGAPNVKAGMRTIFAPIGSVLPGKEVIKIGKARIRGIDSNGMLCSEKELGLGDNQEGIIELGRNTKLGICAADIYGLADPLIDMSITPNRGDCLGIYGIARDLAAVGIGKLKKLRTPIIRTNGFTGEHNLTLNSKNCPRFLFREVKNLKNRRSPEWLENRLKSIGLTPKNALVDIGNYTMFSFGKPVHFYDLSSLEGNLSVRDSMEGESFVDLFGNEHKLPSGAVVICDEKKILCLGGVLGSKNSSVTKETSGVLIESAIFNPINIARTAKLLNIRSDTAFRFERGNDYEMVDFALDYASSLLKKICGGDLGEAVNREQSGYRKSLTRNVRLNHSQIEKRLGLKITKKDVLRILKSLGYGVAKKAGDRSADVMVLEIPLFRNNIVCAEEIIDDLIRIYGYHNLLDGDFIDQKVHEKEDSHFHRKFEDNLQRIRKKLASNGLMELVTYSFLRKEDSGYFSKVNDELDLINPIISDFSHMRQNMIPNILNVLVRNCSRGLSDLSLFEIGHVYNECAIDREDNVICGVRYGNYKPRDCHGGTREFDIFDVKKDIFDVLTIFGLDNQSVVRKETPRYYHQGRSGAIVGENGIILGYFGELHPALVTKFSLKSRPMVFEFFIDRVPKDILMNVGFRTSDFVVNDLQPITRDFSFILEEQKEVGNLIRDVGNINKTLISQVFLFDIYSYGDGKKSIGITVEIQPVDKTLNKDEIDNLSGAVVELVSSRYGGILRDG
ncbi:MAG: phenylalanine--tRNA ligase subunit beta [Rickettsiales bacterium]|jgi:phenylalanyl-tRNA synthetase beta chain|nr:phenylalanine--tRNA ligase subunit beta [Rickettsiales bacterium]